MREWYTHIGGSPSRLQSSTRYIDYNDFKYVTPPTVKQLPEAKNIYDNTINTISKAYESLQKLGIPKEDCSMLLSFAMETTVIEKCNLRHLIDMSSQRLCTKAYWEYRELFNEFMSALKDYSEEWKYIVETKMKPKCEITGYCSEKKSCGRVLDLLRDDILEKYAFCINKNESKIVLHSNIV